MLLDPHIHSEGLGACEIRKMAENGIKKVFSLYFYPIKPLFPQTLIDGFRRLEEFESARCLAFGVELIPGVGIHPRCIPPDYETVLDHLEANDWTLFGEIGLETASEKEVKVFEAQIRIAMAKDIPCVIHTPRAKKRIVTEKTLEILERLSFPPELGVIDHVNFENLDLLLSKDFWIGLTVQTEKLSALEVLRIVEEHGTEKFVVNSDAGFGNENVTAIADVAKLLGKKAEKVCFKNALKFLGV
ncbi:MAG: TatD family hydrolase [Archaeoglobaceae archaeon]